MNQPNCKNKRWNHPEFANPDLNPISLLKEKNHTQNPAYADSS
jgi:hypothetical protein